MLESDYQSNGAPKIGVYVCHCGINISAKVDIDAVVEFASGLPHVAVAREYKFMCSDPGQELIQRDIKELGLQPGRGGLLFAPDARGHLPARYGRSG